MCVLIHFKLTLPYFSKSFSFGSGYSHPTHTPTHTPRKLYKHPRSIARQVNSSDRPSGTYGQVNQPWSSPLEIDQPPTVRIGTGQVYKSSRATPPPLYDLTENQLTHTSTNQWYADHVVWKICISQKYDPCSFKFIFFSLILKITL